MNHIYRNFIRPILFKLNPEDAHDIACRCLSLTEKSNFSRKLIQSITYNKPSVVNVFGLSFPNQLGLAAGMDKSARFPKTSASLGFGHVEIGTVTPKNQSGNTKPRLFRYPKYNALVNRMGFNNDGVDVIIKRINKFYPKGNRIVPLGINIGKSRQTEISDAHEDYIYCLRKSHGEADYITINISSPNTKNLRELHKDSYIKPLLKNLVSVNQELAKQYKSSPVPLLLKISPDENFITIENIVCLAKELGFSGVIAANTSAERQHNNTVESFEQGGLSGEPLETKSNNLIKFISKVTNYDFPIIGVGGIGSTDAAIKKLDSGATLLQIYTSLVYEGPFFPSKLIHSLKHRKRNWV